MSSLKRWGATPEEWNHFDLALGLTEDILPVVSNITAVISPESKMQAVGKTPSYYNKQRQVVGIVGWTQTNSKQEDVSRWMRIPDYGICVQTRRLRAIDIDIEDVVLSTEVYAEISKLTGKSFPMRWRTNTGKMLLPFYQDGEHGKVVVRLNDGKGLVEILRHGQQFIAAGTHPSGVRYRWGLIRGGPEYLPEVTDIPTLTEEEVNAITEKISKAYGDGESSSSNAAGARRVNRKERHDDWVTDFLRDSLWYRGEEGDGRVHIWCPWIGGHSMDSGETECTYFPQGSNNFERGTFRCMHASCAKRTNGDFLAITGAGVDGFEALPDNKLVPLGGATGRQATARTLQGGSKDSVPGPSGVQGRDAGVDRVGGARQAGRDEQHQLLAGPLFEGDEGSSDLDSNGLVGLERNIILLGDSKPLPRVIVPAGGLPALPTLSRNADGRVRAEIQNCTAVMSRPEFMGFEIALDEFRDEIVLGSHANGWQRVRDAHLVEIRIRLASYGFIAVPHEMVRHALLHCAYHNRFDSAQLWLEGWTWDGTSRVERFMADYMGAADTPYARAMSRYIWSTLAGRVIEPGVKADIVPIWMSPEEGIGKSSMVSALVPDKELYGEMSFNESDPDIARKMRGKLAIEITELRGLHTKDAESVLAWASRQHEEFVPKYVEYATRFPRRILAIGTTNSNELLQSDRTNRRWAPIELLNPTKLDKVKRDRGQLWAEGAEIFRTSGIQWQDLQKLARAEHSAFEVSDEWLNQISDWIYTNDNFTGRHPATESFLSTGDIFRHALGFDPKHVRPGDEIRLGRIMRTLGYRRVRQWDGISQKRVWSRPS